MIHRAAQRSRFFLWFYRKRQTALQESALAKRLDHILSDLMTNCWRACHPSPEACAWVCIQICLCMHVKNTTGW